MLAPLVKEDKTEDSAALVKDLDLFLETCQIHHMQGIHLTQDYSVNIKN